MKKQKLQVINYRQWRSSTLAEAKKEFNRKLKSKTNPRRKSLRKYILAGCEPQNPL